jgi:hypothetical protein
MTPATRTAARLMFVTAAARLAAMALLPPRAVSLDLRHWEMIAELIANGVNPYVTTSYLNWPPFWALVLAALGPLGSVMITVRLLLIAVDCVNVWLALRIARDASRPLLVGFALSPVAILLTAQHGNFDAFAVTAILCAILALRGDRWLLACVALGIGVSIKTFPIILAPILAPGIGQRRIRTILFGALLLVLPAGLPMFVLWRMAPEETMRHVVRYHSFGGWFGLSAILPEHVHVIVFKVVAIAALIALTVLLARRRAVDTVLITTLILTGVILLGPGFGPQYAMWILVLLPLCWDRGGSRWKTLLVTTHIVASITYLAEYALFPTHGAFLTPMPLSPRATTLLRLPLFVCLAAVLAAGVPLAQSRFAGERS